MPRHVDHYYISKEGLFKWVARSAPDSMVWENCHGIFRTAKKARAAVEELRPGTGLGDGKTQVLGVWVTVHTPYKKSYLVWEAHKQVPWRIDYERMVAKFKTRRAANRHAKRLRKKYYGKNDRPGWLKRWLKKGKIS